MSVQSDLAAAAKCYCFDPNTADQVLVYLLAKKANLLSVSPSQLAGSAKCFCFDDATYRSVVAYLWESISKNGETPVQLAAASKCFCFDDATQRGVVVYLLNSIAGTSVAATSLPALTKCYCFNGGTQKEVVAYLLETISGLNQTPVQLAVAAKCFCFDEGLYKSAVTYLLNSINSVPIGPPGPPNITNGLVNWWKFDENSGVTASDSIAGDTGTFHGSVGWVPGVINSALNFNGTDWLELATNTSAGAGAFTFSAWLKPASLVTGNIILDDDGDVTSGFSIDLQTGQVRVNIVASVTDLTRLGSTSIPAGVFTYLVVTWDGTISDATKCHIYLNTIEDTYNSSQNGSGTHLANTTPAFIGGNATIGSHNSIVSIIDDVRLWNRVLSASEITNMFQWRGKP